MRQLFSITSLHHVLLALRMKSYIHSLRQRSTWLNEPLTQHSLPFVYNETDTLIGHLFEDNSNEPDSNTWSVGWHFNQRFEHQGYASESVAALFDYLFKVKGARRLYAWVEDYNYSSQKLCERLLMRREGCFKEFVSFENEEGKARYDDTYIYALLQKEWVK